MSLKLAGKCLERGRVGEWHGVLWCRAEPRVPACGQRLVRLNFLCVKGLVIRMPRCEAQRERERWSLKVVDSQVSEESEVRLLVEVFPPHVWLWKPTDRYEVLYGHWIVCWMDPVVAAGFNYTLLYSLGFYCFRRVPRQPSLFRQYSYCRVRYWQASGEEADVKNQLCTHARTRSLLIKYESSNLASFLGIGAHGLWLCLPWPAPLLLRLEMAGESFCIHSWMSLLESFLICQ